MGISDVLEKLQMNENQMVYEKTLTILETYFETEK